MKAKFKVGDIVTINFIKGSDCYDYPLSFVDSMRDYHGKKAKITRVDVSGSSDSKFACFYDEHAYSLDLKGRWCWSSSMFLEAQEI